MGFQHLHGHSFLCKINFCFLYPVKIELFRQFVWVPVLLVETIPGFGFMACEWFAPLSLLLLLPGVGQHILFSPYLLLAFFLVHTFTGQNYCIRFY